MLPNGALNNIQLPGHVVRNNRNGPHWGSSRRTPPKRNYCQSGSTTTSNNRSGPHLGCQDGPLPNRNCFRIGPTTLNYTGAGPYWSCQDESFQKEMPTKNVPTQHHSLPELSRTYCKSFACRQKVLQKSFACSGWALIKNLLKKHGYHSGPRCHAKAGPSRQTCPWIPKMDPGIWSQGSGSRIRSDHRSNPHSLRQIHWDHRSSFAIRQEILSDPRSKTPYRGGIHRDPISDRWNSRIFYALF